MKVFISMPMKSKSTAQVRAEMRNVFEYIKKRLPEAELIDSVIDGADVDIAVAVKGDSKAIWFLGESVRLMSEADIVFFVNDWKKYRGCSSERKIAEDYGKFCVELKV